MVDGILGIEAQHGREDLLDLRDLSHSADDDRAGAEHLGAVGVLLRHGQRVLTRGDVDAERDRQIRGRLYGIVETSVLTWVAAGPHPVGTQRDALQPVGQRGEDDIGQRLGDRQLRARYGVDQRGGWGVPDRGRHTRATAEVHSHSPAVAQRQL